MKSEPSFDQLCSVCRDLFSKEPMHNATSKDGYNVPFHEQPNHSTHDLHSTAQNGCHICSLLCGRLLLERRETLRSDREHNNTEVLATIRETISEDLHTHRSHFPRVWYGAVPELKPENLKAFKAMQ